MDITMLVAKVLGIYLVVSGLFLILKGKSVALLLKDFFNHPAIVYLTGVILIFLSSIYLLQYNIWGGWQSFITLLVWVVFLKGVTYIFAPHFLSQSVIERSRKWFGAYGFIAVIVGLFLFFWI